MPKMAVPWRTSHSAITSPIQLSAANATGSGAGTNPGHFPRTAATKNQIEQTLLTAAKIVPPAFVMSAAKTWPLVNRLQEVVIPHAGQGKPQSVWIVQGPNPGICWWVPMPLGSGFSENARPSTANIVTETSARPARIQTEIFALAAVWGANGPSAWRAGGYESGGDCGKVNLVSPGMLHFFPILLKRPIFVEFRAIVDVVAFQALLLRAC